MKLRSLIGDSMAEVQRSQIHLRASSCKTEKKNCKAEKRAIKK